MNFSPHVFRAYDIRGLADTELSEEMAYRIGRAFVRVMKQKGEIFEQKSVVVGRDMRKTSPAFAHEVIRGICDEGIDVVDIGMTTTPVFNVTVADHPDFAGGIMVTASHNPVEYNGFKLTMGDGLPIGKPTGMDDLKNIVIKEDFSEVAEKTGALRSYDAISAYVEKIFSLVDISTCKSLKIVVDGGNGMSNVVLPKIIERLPLEVTYMYMEPDGSFPNHEANPLKSETLADLQQRVKEVGADFGFALDGDADRIGMVDEKGDIVPPSYVSTLIGLEYLKEHPGIHMMYDLRSSQIHKEVFEAAGATTERCMVGHANIKKMMKEKGASFASELSLHLFFGNVYCLESTDLSLIYIVKALSDTDQSVSEYIAPFKKYVHSGEINFEVENKDEVMTAIENMYAKDALEVSDLDGLWMRFDWGWVSIRKSNTEGVLRLNIETNSQQETDQKVAEFSDKIQMLSTTE